jgi:hypothetical protein
VTLVINVPNLFTMLFINIVDKFAEFAADDFALQFVNALLVTMGSEILPEFIYIIRWGVYNINNMILVTYLGLLCTLEVWNRILCKHPK